MRLVDVFLALVKQNRALCFTQNMGAVVSPKIEYFRPGIVY